MALNGTENGTLTSRQELVALALAACQSIPEAAAWKAVETQCGFDQSLSVLLFELRQHSRPPSQARQPHLRDLRVPAARQRLDQTLKALDRLLRLAFLVTRRNSWPQDPLRRGLQ
jgi:hypothetical protein